MRTGVVYKDERFYSAFPSVVRLRDGTLVVGFRRAPRREPYSTHLDSESTAVMVASGDDGENWSEPRTIYRENNDVGIQDPSITQLRDGTLVANFFSWRVIKKEPFNHHVLGTFIVRSFDNGESWEKEPREVRRGYCATSEPVVELPDGRLVIPLYDAKGAFVMKSEDRGQTWQDRSDVAVDPFGNISFEEPALCLLPSGKLLCVLRVPDPGYLFQSESLDGGETWSVPKKLDIWGFPANLLVLRDGRVLCAYGYRRPPYGARGCVSEDEGKSWNLQGEIVIRDDGFHGDLGYPSSVELDDGSVLTAYYFHTGSVGDHNKDVKHYSQPAGTRFIACSRYSLA